MDPTRLQQTLEVVLAEESVIATAETIVNSPGKTIEPRTRQSVDQARTLLERLRSTRITVAHRLSAVRNAALIVVLDKGKIVERGTHHELVAKRGLYHALLKASETPAEVPHVAKAS